MRVGKQNKEILLGRHSPFLDQPLLATSYDVQQSILYHWKLEQVDESLRVEVHSAQNEEPTHGIANHKSLWDLLQRRCRVVLILED